MFGWMKTVEGSAALDIVVWSARDWQGTSWLRPTIWSGWRTWCPVRSPGRSVRVPSQGVVRLKRPEGASKPLRTTPESADSAPKSAFSLTKRRQCSLTRLRRTVTCHSCAAC